MVRQGDYWIREESVRYHALEVVEPQGKLYDWGSTQKTSGQAQKKLPKSLKNGIFFEPERWVLIESEWD